MNKVIMMGRLTRDPEVSYSSNSSSPLAIGKFSLAVDRKNKKSNDTVTADFFNCTCFGKLAEFTEKYLKKGSKILISGRLQNNNYTNKEGQKVYSTEILVDEIDFAESKSASTRDDYNRDSGSNEVETSDEQDTNVSGDMRLPF